MVGGGGGSFWSLVFNLEGIEVSCLLDIIKAHEMYYDNLFANEKVDLTIQNDLLSNVSARG